MPLPRRGATESISSKKIMHGEAWRALRKTSLTAFSDSPTYLLSSSGPLTLMKFASLSFAAAFARSVLPVPGGPYNNSPFGGTAFICAKSSGYFSGHSMASRSSSLTPSRPPISSHLISGTSTRTSLIAEGSTSFSASWKSLIRTMILLRTSAGMFSASKLISGRILRSARMAASFASASKSAPTNP